MSDEIVRDGWAVVRTSSVDLDFGSYDPIDRFVQNLAKKWTRFDALVILSGVCPGKSLAEYEEDQTYGVMSINFTGPALLIQAMLRGEPSLLDKHGRIVVMSSISAERGSYDPFYAASKAALNGFVKSLARDYHINAIAPGLIEGSTMWFEMAPERREQHREQTPGRKLVTIPEIGKLVAQMCGPAWASIRGHVLHVNGGAYV